MNKIKTPFDFEVNLYGDLVPYTDTISRCRCRIFYKYGNRNGSYITDEFAEQLVKTLPYAPVKGIYDDIDEDYTDHGKHRSLGKIYGIVPVDNHFEWENHLDEDGVERVYACSDVLVYTALYKEAKEIINKPQSMEIYPDTAEGDWKTIEGQQYYVFTKGSFLGLQILGKETLPCFEGAAFYSLYEQFEKIFTEINKYNEFLSYNVKGQEGNTQMTINFATTLGNFFDLWYSLNTNFTEEGNWTINYEIVDIQDNFALVKNLETNNFERVSFSVNEVESTSEDGEITKTQEFSAEAPVVAESYKIVDATDYIARAVEAFGVESFDNFTEILEKATEMKNKISEFESKIVEKDEMISTLQTERDNLQASNEAQSTQLNDLTTENNELKAFKLEVETQKKETVIAKYAARLDPEIIDQFKEKMADYTLEGLDKELAYALVTNDASLFETDNNTTAGRVPKPQLKTGIEAILDNYKK